MIRVTLDTNCIIDLEKRAQTARHIRTLMKMHEDGKINLRVVAISASERKRDGTYGSNFAEFKNRIAALGLGSVEILKPLGHFDITYFDWCLFAHDENDPMVELERKIHGILFPEIEFSYAEFCRRNGLDPNSGEVDKRWRNPKCDVLALWSHIYHRGDVFVTRDNNFHGPSKKPHLVALGAGEIMRPGEAVARLVRLGVLPSQSYHQA